MKIGILGGSFNPIHKGHLYIATEALKSGVIEQVWFTPSYTHPFIHKRQVPDFDIRVDLIEKAIKGNSKFSICTLEKTITPPSYTEKLMKLLFEKFPEHEFFFITGFDLVADLRSWHNFSYLRNNVNFLFFTRGEKLDWSRLKELAHYQVIQIESLDISSTQIRERVKENKSIKGLVSSQIEKEIISLYKTSTTG